MKNIESKNKINIIKKTDEHYILDSMDFEDFVVYNEMTDQTTIRINLLEHISSQLNQLEEISKKRQFLLKEVLQHIIE